MISSFLKHLLYNGYMPSTSPTNKPPASTVRIQFHMRKKRLQLHYNFTKLITRCHSLFLLWSEQTHQHGPTIHAWLHSEPFLAAWTVCSLQSTVDSNEIEGFTKMMGMRSQHAVFGEKVGFQPLELTGKRICIYLSIYLSILGEWFFMKSEQIEHHIRCCSTNDCMFLRILSESYLKTSH